RSVVSSSYSGRASAHRLRPAKAWARQNLAHGSSRNRGSANKTRVSSGCLAATWASASFSATTCHSVSGGFLFNSACNRAIATSGTPSVSGALASAISAEMSARANCASMPSRQLSPIFFRLISSPALAANIALCDCWEVLRSPPADQLRRDSRQLLHLQIENIGDIFAFVSDLKRLTVVPLAMAYFAFDVHVRQKVHLDLN